MWSDILTLRLDGVVDIVKKCGVQRLLWDASLEAFQ
ncbi:MAG: hypothetical protein QOI11_659, partial [Candidatus Eremiobacteraeota bacterium]|nr:hypothetical protein [Candidatus Eremiobacteraeota bacterium]